jgi:AcrR family transcriptional regulator
LDIKEKIILACREMSRLGGFFNINMDELALRAGVSKRTVYRYFRSKEEIIEAVLDAFMLETEAEIDRLLTIEMAPDVFITEILKYLSTNGQFIINPVGLDDLRKHYPYLWQKLDNFRTDRIRNIIKILITSIKNPIIMEIDQRIISAVILASIKSVMTPDFILDNGLTFEETAGQLGQLLISAFVCK